MHKGTHGFLGLLRRNIYLQKATSMKWKDEIWPPSIPSFQGVFSLEPKCTRMTWPPTGRRTKELTTEVHIKWLSTDSTTLAQSLWGWHPRNPIPLEQFKTGPENTPGDKEGRPAVLLRRANVASVESGNPSAINAEFLAVLANQYLIDHPVL